MPLSKEIASGMIGSITERPALLHGTSVEAVLKMFETGVLPSGRACHDLNGYLFFVPIGCLPAYWIFSQALEEVKSYAEGNAEEVYIVEQLKAAGIHELHAEQMMCNWIYGERFHVPEAERKKAERIYDGGLCEQAKKRKGVVLEVSTDVLDLDVEDDPNDEGLRLRCPGGLPAEYVRKIEPQGAAEAELLSVYLTRIS
jgi:hypothetical protein